MNTNQLIIEQVSPFDVPTTVEKLIAAADKREWQNPANHNLQQSLAKSGKEVRPVQVVEICKSDYSGKMLERNDERISSILMPCRISVYTEQGKTKIGLIKPAQMLLTLSQDKALAEVANKVEEQTMQMVDEAK